MPDMALPSPQTVKVGVIHNPYCLSGSYSLLYLNVGDITNCKSRGGPYCLSGSYSLLYLNVGDIRGCGQAHPPPHKHLKARHGLGHIGHVTISSSKRNN